MKKKPKHLKTSRATGLLGGCSLKKTLYYLSFVYFCSLLLILIPSANAALLSDQGTNLVTSATGQLLETGNLTITIHDAMTAGNEIYNYTWNNTITNGSWNVMIGEPPGPTLTMEYGKTYYKDYLINNEDADYTNGTGISVERLAFTSPIGTINATTYIQNQTITGNQIKPESINQSHLNLTDITIKDLDNDAGYFNDTDNFTGNLVNTKYCTYNATSDKIDCISTGGSGSDTQWPINNTDFLNVSSLLQINRTTWNNTNWDLAYGWGDHNLVGYITIDTNESARVDALMLENQSLHAAHSDYINTSLGGTISGNLIVTGNFTTLGDYVNATVTNQYLNGTFQPGLNNTFNLGTQTNLWKNLYAVTITGNLACTQITGSASNLCTLLDTNISDTNESTWVQALATDNTTIRTQQSTINSTLSFEIDELNATLITDTNDTIWVEALAADNTSTLFSIDELNATIEADTDTTWSINLTDFINQTSLQINRTTWNNTDWDLAYSWGDHSLAGYITTNESANVYALMADNTTTRSWISTINSTLNFEIDELNATIESDTNTDTKWLLNSTDFQNTSSLLQINRSTWNNTNWDLAYGWGDHSLAGYITTNESVNVYALMLDNATTRSWISTINSTLSFEIDELNATIEADTDTDTQWSINTTDFLNVSTLLQINRSTWNNTNWDLVYGWGDHSLAGYITTNESANVYALMADNISMDERVIDIQTDYLNKTGDSMTGQLNMTNNNITNIDILCLNANCSWYTNSSDNCMYWPSGGRMCSSA